MQYFFHFVFSDNAKADNGCSAKLDGNSIASSVRNIAAKNY